MMYFLVPHRSLRSTSYESTHPTLKISPSEISFSEVSVQISDGKGKRMLFWCLLRKIAPIYPDTDELWRAEDWPKVVSSLVSPLYVSHCYFSSVVTLSGFSEDWIMFYQVYKTIE